jgi:hypothetical protein
MTFEVYLSSKKIDSEKFRQAESSTWADWKATFEQMHPNSFTAQKLYLINPVRRKYPLTETPAPPVSAPTAAAKPKMKPKIS